MDLRRRGQKAVKYHGLMNQGATCYLNSVLQVLFMTKDFRDAVKKYCSTEHIDSELRDLFKDLEEYDAYTYNITKKLKIQNVLEQRDAAEHYEKILRLTSPEASQIFHGELKNWNICKQCETKTGSAAGFWSLPLPLVNSNNHYSVEQGIADFFRPSELSGDDQMYCEKCDEKRDAVLHCEVTHQPDILVLLLKRFEFDYRHMTYVKINQPVDVPFTVQIPQNQWYQLYAFVEHFGELQYGHYISKIWSQDDNKWYIFNDSSVHPSKDSPPALERSQSAYLLFYRKQKEAAMVTLTKKRSFEESEQEDKPVKKPKQELSAEEQLLFQTDQKSPERQDLDVSGCSSSQKMYYPNLAEENQKYKVDFSGISQEASEQKVELEQPNKKAENITLVSAHEDQLDRLDESESAAFCTDEMRSSHSDTDLTSEQIFTMEVGGGQQRQESHNISSHIGDNMQHQRNSCETGDKNCSVDPGQSVLDVNMQAVNVKQKQTKAALLGMENCCELEARGNTVDHFGKRFPRQYLNTSDSFLDHQTHNPNMTSANQISQSSECNADDCKIDIEFSGHSTISQESNDFVIVDQLEIRPQWMSDTKQSSHLSPNKHSILETETVLESEDGKDGLGKGFNLGASITEEQSGQHGRQEGDFIKPDTDDFVQNHQRSFCKTSDKNCVDIRGCEGPAEQWRNLPKAALPGMGQVYEEEAVKTFDDDFDNRFQGQDIGPSSSSLGQQMFKLDEIKPDNAKDEISTEDTVSSKLNMPAVMRQSNNYECAKVEEEVVINSVCGKTVARPDMPVNQYKDQPDVRKGQESQEDNGDSGFQETAQQTELDSPDSSKKEDLFTSGVRHESTMDSGFSCCCSQVDLLYKSNDRFKTTMGNIPNVSSVAGAVRGESVHRCFTNAFEETNPGFRDSENRRDFEQSPSTMQEVKVQVWKHEQEMDTGQLKRTESSNLRDDCLRIESQGRTGRKEGAHVGSGSEVKKKPLKIYDLYLHSIQNQLNSTLDSYNSERWDRDTHKSESQKIPAIKCSQTMSAVEKSEEIFEERRSVDSSKSDKESKQRETVAHEDRLTGTVFQSRVVTQAGNTETVWYTLSRKQSAKDGLQVERRGSGDLHSFQSDRNAENPTDTLTEAVDCLTLSRGVDGVKTERK